MYRPLINGQQWFCKQFCLHGDICKIKDCIIYTVQCTLDLDHMLATKQRGIGLYNTAGSRQRKCTKTPRYIRNTAQSKTPRYMYCIRNTAQSKTPWYIPNTAQSKTQRYIRNTAQSKTYFGCLIFQRNCTDLSSKSKIVFADLSLYFKGNVLQK